MIAVDLSTNTEKEKIINFNIQSFNSDIEYFDTYIYSSDSIKIDKFKTNIKFIDISTTTKNYDININDINLPQRKYNLKYTSNNLEKMYFDIWVILKESIRRKYYLNYPYVGILKSNYYIDMVIVNIIKDRDEWRERIIEIPQIETTIQEPIYSPNIMEAVIEEQNREDLIIIYDLFEYDFNINQQNFKILEIKKEDIKAIKFLLQEAFLKEKYLEAKIDDIVFTQTEILTRINTDFNDNIVDIPKLIKKIPELNTRILNFWVQRQEKELNYYDTYIQYNEDQIVGFSKYIFSIEKNDFTQIAVDLQEKNEELQNNNYYITTLEKENKNKNYNIFSIEKDSFENLNVKIDNKEIDSIIRNYNISLKENDLKLIDFNIFNIELETNIVYGYIQEQTINLISLEANIQDLNVNRNSIFNKKQDIKLDNVEINAIIFDKDSNRNELNVEINEELFEKKIIHSNIFDIQNEKRKLDIDIQEYNIKSNILNIKFYDIENYGNILNIKFQDSNYISNTLSVNFSDIDLTSNTLDIKFQEAQVSNNRLFIQPFQNIGYNEEIVVSSQNRYTIDELLTDSLLEISQLKIEMNSKFYAYVADLKLKLNERAEEAKILALDSSLSTYMSIDYGTYLQYNSFIIVDAIDERESMEASFIVDIGNIQDEDIQNITNLYLKIRDKSYEKNLTTEQVSLELLNEIYAQNVNIDNISFDELMDNVGFSGMRGINLIINDIPIVNLNVDLSNNIYVAAGETVYDLTKEKRFDTLEEIFSAVASTSQMRATRAVRGGYLQGSSVEYEQIPQGYSDWAMSISQARTDSRRAKRYISFVNTEEIAANYFGLWTDVLGIGGDAEDNLSTYRMKELGEYLEELYYQTKKDDPFVGTWEYYDWVQLPGGRTAFHVDQMLDKKDKVLGISPYIFTFWDPQTSFAEIEEINRGLLDEYRIQKEYYKSAIENRNQGTRNLALVVSFTNNGVEPINADSANTLITSFYEFRNSTKENMDGQILYFDTDGDGKADTLLELDGLLADRIYEALLKSKRPKELDAPSLYFDTDGDGNIDQFSEINSTIASEISRNLKVLSQIRQSETPSLFFDRDGDNITDSVVQMDINFSEEAYQALKELKKGKTIDKPFLLFDDNGDGLADFLTEIAPELANEIYKNLELIRVGRKGGNPSFYFDTNTDGQINEVVELETFEASQIYEGLLSSKQRRRIDNPILYFDTNGDGRLDVGIEITDSNNPLLYERIIESRTRKEIDNPILYFDTNGDGNIDSGIEITEDNKSLIYEKIVEARTRKEIDNPILYFDTNGDGNIDYGIEITEDNKSLIYERIIEARNKSSIDNINLLFKTTDNDFLIKIGDGGNAANLYKELLKNYDENSVLGNFLSIDGSNITNLNDISDIIDEVRNNKNNNYTKPTLFYDTDGDGRLDVGIEISPLIAGNVYSSLLKQRKSRNPITPVMFIDTDGDGINDFSVSLNEEKGALIYNKLKESIRPKNMDSIMLFFDTNGDGQADVAFEAERNSDIYNSLSNLKDGRNIINPILYYDTTDDGAIDTFSSIDKENAAIIYTALDLAKSGSEIGNPILYFDTTGDGEIDSPIEVTRITSSEIYSLLKESKIAKEKEPSKIFFDTNGDGIPETVIELKDENAFDIYSTLSSIRKIKEINPFLFFDVDGDNRVDNVVQVNSLLGSEIYSYLKRSIENRNIPEFLFTSSDGSTISPNDILDIFNEYRINKNSVNIPIKIFGVLGEQIAEINTPVDVLNNLINAFERFRTLKTLDGVRQTLDNSTMSEQNIQEEKTRLINRPLTYSLNSTHFFNKWVRDRGLSQDKGRGLRDVLLSHGYIKIFDNNYINNFIHEVIPFQNIPIAQSFAWDSQWAELEILQKNWKPSHYDATTPLQTQLETTYIALSGGRVSERDNEIGEIDENNLHTQFWNLNMIKGIELFYKSLIQPNYGINRDSFMPPPLIEIHFGSVFRYNTVEGPTRKVHKPRYPGYHGGTQWILFRVDRLEIMKDHEEFNFYVRDGIVQDQRGFKVSMNLTEVQPNLKWNPADFSEYWWAGNVFHSAIYVTEQIGYRSRASGEGKPWDEIINSGDIWVQRGAHGSDYWGVYGVNEAEQQSTGSAKDFFGRGDRAS